MKSIYPRLFSIEHSLEKVKLNGLPESEYNKSLEDFDHKMCSLFENSTHGIIILIETFAGKRIYYFYVTETIDISTITDKIKKQFLDYELDMTIKNDENWGLLTEYPIDIYRH